MWGKGEERCREKVPLIVRVEEVGWRCLWGELLDLKNRCAEGLPDC
jgi:hypothetical protein